MATKNRAVYFVKRPVGVPDASSIELREDEVPTITGDAQLVLRTLYLSVDPYMRPKMTEVKSYTPPFELNKPLEGMGVAQVVESNSADFEKGDIVSTFIAWREYNVVSASPAIRKIPNYVRPLHLPLGLLGAPGATAHIGLFKTADTKAGETVVISAAAGAVGSVAGQLAKLKGAYVVGLAGSGDKCALLTKKFGYDVAVNYKHPTWREDLAAACPKGVDVYFDNVGGEILDEVLLLMNTFGRIAACGSISQYNKRGDGYGLQNTFRYVTSRLTVKGFLITDHLGDFPAVLGEMGKQLMEGKLNPEATVTEGLENIWDAFLGLFSGQNIGKAVVKVADPL